VSCPILRIHPAIVAQAAWSSVLVLSGTLAQLVNYTGFAVVLFAGIAVSTLFVFAMWGLFALDLAR